MLSIYLEIYAAFLSLLFLFFMANSIMPKVNKKTETAKNYRPRVLVIVPCRGRDIGLEDNLEAAKRQTYKKYSVMAVVDSENDVALEAIGATRTKFIVSDFKCGNCSGKVRALCSAISKFKDYDAYVVLDSDVLVSTNWLADLIAPLGDRSVGISTAFPIFMPKGGFWSKVKHAWGFIGHSLMERERSRFGWGGSLAFRKELLSGSGFDDLSNSVSDDITLTKIAKAKGLEIAYVKAANPMVMSDENFGGFAEWSNRQTAFFLVGSPKTFYYGIAYYCASMLLLVSSILLAAFASPIFIVFALPAVLGAIRLYRRSGGYAYMLALYFLMDPIYVANLIKARGLRRIEWRGRSYDIGMDAE